MINKLYKKYSFFSSLSYFFKNMFFNKTNTKKIKQIQRKIRRKMKLKLINQKKNEFFLKKKYF